MLRLFYFSGTGNARRAAHWIADAWHGRGRAAEVIDLAPIDARTIQIGPDDEVGLASPTHGFASTSTTFRR